MDSGARDLSALDAARIHTLGSNFEREGKDTFICCDWLSIRTNHGMIPVVVLDPGVVPHEIS